MLDNDLSYGQLKFFIKEVYFYVLNCSKQGFLPAKVRLLGEIPLIPHERRKKMNSQEKQGYIDEINYQKKMIHNLIKWLRNLFFLSSLGVLLMYYFSNILFVKIFAIILIIISILAIILVGKAIYSGKKNINKIVD